MEFVARFWSCWHRAHSYGVGGYDGIVLLVDALPNEWREWAQATAKRFFRCSPPSVALDGDMDEFVKAMFDYWWFTPRDCHMLLRWSRRLNLPFWTLPGREKSELSRSSRTKRVRIEDRDLYDSEEEESDEKDEYDVDDDDGRELGDGGEEQREQVEEDGKGKAVLEEGDPNDDEDPEERPYIETSGVEEAKSIPPPPLVPPPIVQPPPVEVAYDYLPPLPPSEPFYYVDYTIPMGIGTGRTREESKGVDLTAGWWLHRKSRWRSIRVIHQHVKHRLYKPTHISIQCNRGWVASEKPFGCSLSPLTPLIGQNIH